MAAMLLAGLDGIANKLDPVEAGYGPINEDIFSWSPEQRKTIKSLPTSLSEALRALENDVDFLVRDGVFQETLVDQWLSVKHEEECSVRSRPHPYEIQLYFDL
jgi:glutamine synthetase